MLAKVTGGAERLAAQRALMRIAAVMIVRVRLLVEDEELVTRELLGAEAAQVVPEAGVAAVTLDMGNVREGVRESESARRTREVVTVGVLQEVLVERHRTGARERTQRTVVALLASHCLAPPISVSQLVRLEIVSAREGCAARAALERF